MKIEEEIKQGTFLSEHQKATINILFTSHWLNSKLIKILKPFSSTPQQFNVLRILKGQYPNAISVNDIMSRMLDKMSNASRLVEKLRKKGLIERITCEHDRRQVDVKITKEGIKLLTKMSKEVEHFDELKSNQNSIITIKEAKELNRILEKLRG